MVQNIFGVKAKDIISFEKDYDDYKSGKTGHVKSQVDRAKALRGVWKVQEGQNKRSKKENNWGFTRRWFCCKNRRIRT